MRTPLLLHRLLLALLTASELLALLTASVPLAGASAGQSSTAELGAAPAPAAEEPPPQVGLPPGPAAEAWSAVGAATPHASLAAYADLPASPSDPRWDAPEAWDLWVALVRAEAAAEQPDPARRAALALLARAQGRSDDAWAHFAACRARPDVVAGLLPALLFGPQALGSDESAAHGALRGPVLPALAEGVLLRPLPPPPDPDLPPSQPQRRELALEGLRIGDATVALRLSVDANGAEIDFEHRTGPATRCAVLLPPAPDRETAVEYFDWARVDSIGAPHRFELLPGGERLTAWARYGSEPDRWPRLLPSGPFDLLADAGLELVVRADDPGRARGAEAARALGELLGVPAGLREPDRPPARAGAIAIELPPPPLGARKLAATISLAERFALRPRSAGR